VRFIALRRQQNASLELLFREPDILLPHGEIFSSDLNHGPRRFELVVNRRDTDPRFLLGTLEVFCCSGHLSPVFANQCAPLAGIEQIVSQMNSECSEDLVKEGNALLIAVAAVRCDFWSLANQWRLTWNAQSTPGRRAHITRKNDWFLRSSLRRPSSIQVSGPWRE
jgi:hypothetical protein